MKEYVRRHQAWCHWKPLQAMRGRPPNPYKSLVIVCKFPSSWLDPPDLYDTCVLQDSQETVLAMRHINLKICRDTNKTKICKESCATFLVDFQHVVKRCRTKQGELLSTWFWGFDFRCSKISTPEMLMISWLLQEFKEFKFQGTYSMPKTSWAKHKGWQPKVLAFS